MKTTVDIPDSLLQRAKVTAAQVGTTMRSLLIRGLEQAVDEIDTRKDAGKPAWMAAFGGMRPYREESDQIRSAIEDEFERIDDEAWQ
jgi:hypothetical protein